MTDEKEIKKEEKIEIKKEELEKAKKSISAQVEGLNIHDLLLSAIQPIVKEVIQTIDAIEIEGKRIRIKFK